MNGKRLSGVASLICMALLVWILGGCFNTGHDAGEGYDMDFQKLLRPVSKGAVMQDDAYFIWCGSMVEGAGDGKFHLFYSRWPKSLGFDAWVSHSEVAHAVADNPMGPYRFLDVALPARGALYWDGSCTHNPTVKKFADKYYLYYMGNTGDGKITNGLNFTHRNNQRIGVAVADNPNGPWKRMDKPLIDVGGDPLSADALAVSNPSVVQRPDDGFLIVYKAVGKKKALPFGGPVTHMVAFADSPVGPFVKQERTIFDAKVSSFPAEDPFIWYQRHRYWAILKDMHGAFTNAGRALVLFESEDGLNWRLAKHPLVSKLEVNWENGGAERLERLERPQLWIEKGVPRILFLAAYRDSLHTFNVHILLSASEP